MNPFRFMVSLRFSGKHIDCDYISQHINLKPKHKWKTGEPRKTPKGTLLEGVHERSYCTYPIEKNEGEDLSELLDRVVDELMPHKSLFDEVRESGGEAEFFIGWFTSGNSGDIFTYDLLRKLGELSIDLSFDVYGD